MCTDEALLSRASLDVQRGFKNEGFGRFQARWLFIATWHNVTYFKFGADIHPPVCIVDLLRLLCYNFIVLNYIIHK